MPKTLTEAVKEPPISMVVKDIGRAPIVRYIEFELVALASRISVGGNLNNSQVEFIADQLVEIFPNESLADFKICFERGAIGQYGQIFRMDGIVLRQWMGQYLDEKYAIVENNLMKEKESYNKPQTLTEEVKEQQIKDRLKQWHEAILATGEQKRTSPLTELEVRQEGQQRPKKTVHASTTMADLKEHERKIAEFRRKYYRDCYPDATDEEIEALL